MIRRDRAKRPGSREGHAIRVERVISPDVLMGRLAGYRLIAALRADRRLERRR